MAIRNGRGAGLRRAASRRSGFVALAVTLYFLGGVAATWPAPLDARSHFMSGGADGHGEAAPGDHLQTLYHLWLVGHQLEDGRAPWLDPYTFQPESEPQPNYSGWPFGLLFWPLGAAFGLVGAWNALQLVLYCVAGLLACAWLRELGLPRGPALAGGLIFAIAPYRVQQSVGHLLGPISILLPLSLLAFERSLSPRRIDRSFSTDVRAKPARPDGATASGGLERTRRGSAWWLALSGAALVSIPLSGQVHLALGAIPFFLVYAVCRTRRAQLLAGAGAGAVAAIAAGVLVRETLIEGSTQAGGRSLTEISRYSAEAGDFLSRHVDEGRSEQFVFLGWATPVFALAGLVVLVRARLYALAAVLALGALVPIVLALGTNTPLYSALWHALPPFRFPRVPERLLPIACLCIAALVAFAVARSRRILISALAIAVVAVDLHAQVYEKSAAGDPSRVVPTVAGRLLELPVFDPDVHYGSVYLWYDTAARRERPGGYSTTAPQAAKRTAERLRPLNCGDWSGNMAAELRRLDVRSITLHRGLHSRDPRRQSTVWFAWQGLLAHGWTVQKTAGAVWLFERRRIGLLPTLPEPPRKRPVLCQGWEGRFMSETHAALWIYGSGELQLRFSSSPLPRRVRVDGRPGRRLHGRRWHLVTVDVPRLEQATGEGRRRGLLLQSVATSP